MNERTKDKIKEAFKETCPMKVPIREQIARCMRGDCDNCLQVTKFIGVLQTRPIIKDEDYIEMAIDEAKEEVRQQAYKSACKLCSDYPHCTLLEEDKKAYLTCGMLDNFITEINDYGR